MKDMEFKKIYAELNLSDKNGTMLPLHNSCPNCNICWQNIQDRKPANDAFWTITRPWVGKKYDELKIMVIAINMNEYGSYDGAINLINWTKEEIGRGKIKMFVSETYPGTFLFHRMGSYITAFVENANLINPTWQGDYPSSNDIVSSLDYISYTNHIKCSPVGEKSKPSFQMWDNCGNYILKKEIEILEPHKILVLGNSDNFNYFNANVLDNKISLEWQGKVGTGNGFVNNKEVEITVVPHPASFGGNSSQIMKDLNFAINKR
jgi:hypothetical protein